MIATIQKWDKELETLEHPQKSKIRKIVEHGCLSKEDDATYVCRPILGYNITTYTLRRTLNGGFKCNCQGYNKRGDCSHVQALYILIGNNQKQGELF
jgi:hypothetical protein